MKIASALFALALTYTTTGPVYAQSATPAATDTAAAQKPQCDVPSDLATRLARVPEEVRVYGGKLRIVNVYKRQIEILLDTSATDAQAAQRWLSEVYPRHRAFWAGYIGDEAAFSEFATAFMAYRRAVLCKMAPKVLALDANARFTRHASWLRRQTGKSPQGTWYLAFGSGATDMGGLGDIGMVMDFSSQAADGEALDKLLVHELTHQIHGRRKDADGDTVLGRIVSEGLATYVACVHAAGGRTDADCIGYSETEWRWALANEGKLGAFAKPLLHSRQRADSDSIASRDARPVEGGPGAIGYFIGYRIVDAYVAKHGNDSWKTLLSMPVTKVLADSGYRL